jgi:hypothetical protein
MTDLVIRPLVAGEEPLFDSLPDPVLVGRGVFGERYADGAARGEYRPEWTWVALRGEAVVARAAWWAGPGDAAPTDLLAEATHLLVSEGADRIVASTDVTNTPMAANFAKAGYPITRHRIDLTP